MSNFKIFFLFAVIFVCLFAAGCRDNSQEFGDVSVSSSYLASAVKDVAGDSLDIVSVIPPGMCPGHFDISPSQVSRICSSKVMFIFGFQERMRDSLSSVAKDMQIEAIAGEGGLCVPDTYIEVCRDVCEVLCELFPDKSDKFRKNLSMLEDQMKNFEREVKGEIEKTNLSGEKVVCSVHQADFVEWLGLEVAETFRGRDTETAGNLNECIKSGLAQDARFVIANKQEGSQLAEVVAERIDAKMVVFSNFPKAANGKSDFMKLVEDNISGLAEVK